MAVSIDQNKDIAEIIDEIERLIFFGRYNNKNNIIILNPNLRGPVDGASAFLARENWVWKNMAITENRTARKLFLVIFLIMKKEIKK